MIFILISSNLAMASDDYTPYVGGGPSPSGAWTYNKTTTYTFTNSNLKSINNKYQGIIGSNNYQVGKKAYDVSIVIIGIFGGKPGIVGSTAIGLFSNSYFSEIQKSANVVATAYGKGGSHRLSVVEYIRPLTGEKMLVFK